MEGMNSYTKSIDHSTHSSAIGNTLNPTDPYNKSQGCQISKLEENIENKSTGNARKEITGQSKNVLLLGIDKPLVTLDEVKNLLDSKEASELGCLGLRLFNFDGDDNLAEIFGKIFRIASLKYLDLQFKGARGNVVKALIEALDKFPKNIISLKLDLSESDLSSGENLKEIAERISKGKALQSVVLNLANTKLESNSVEYLVEGLKPLESKLKCLSLNLKQNAGLDLSGLVDFLKTLKKVNYLNIGFSEEREGDKENTLSKILQVCNKGKGLSKLHGLWLDVENLEIEEKEQKLIVETLNENKTRLKFFVINLERENEGVKKELANLAEEKGLKRIIVHAGPVSSEIEGRVGYGNRFLPELEDEDFLYNFYGIKNFEKEEEEVEEKVEKRGFFASNASSANMNSNLSSFNK